MIILKNDNKKFMKTLSDSCLRANRGRNRIAVLAIVLTAVLFMALTTVLEGAQISVRNQMLRQTGTKFMVSIKNLTKEEAEKLVLNPRFTAAGIERYVSSAINPELNNTNAYIGWVDETMAENSFMKLKEGHYPQNEDEIACDTEVLRLLGLPDKTGSTFVMKYTAGESCLEKQMTVCGVYEGMKYEQTAALLVSEQFVEEVLEKYDGKYAPLRETSYDVRGSFAREDKIQEELDALVEEMGYDPDAKRGEEGFIIHHVNPVYKVNSFGTVQTVIFGGIGVLLILFAGYLIIYNIFKISVEKDIRLYGQLKTIGTSPKQICYMVSRQGMALSVIGIPTGLIFGWILGNVFLPLIMANSNFGETEFIVPSVWIWLISGAFTLATVKISCTRPAKIAGKISPVEAVKYYGAPPDRKKHKRGGESRHRILSMAVGNLSRNKGKTFLVVSSISLSAVLLNCVLNYTGSMDTETYVRRDAVTDFDVRNAAFFKSVEEYTKVVPEFAVEKFRNMEGITDFSSSYCYMLPEEDLTEWREDLAKVLSINGSATPSNIEIFDRNRMIYGLDENAFSLTKIVEGSLDYEKLSQGNYVVMAGYLSDKGEYYYEQQEFHPGDILEIQIGEEIKEYEVMAVAGMPNALVMSYSSGGYESVVFSESFFHEKFPEMQRPIHCLFHAEEGKFDEINGQVGAFAEENNLSCFTRLTAEEEFKETKHTYSMVGVIISLILGGIGILNLVNVILTGVIARQREFASMRSIGMTRRQLGKMMVYEGISYAILAGVMGIILSSVLSLTLVKNLSAATWFMKYHFTAVPAVVVFLICMVLSAYISAMADKMWNKGSVVEQLREIE